MSEFMIGYCVGAGLMIVVETVRFSYSLRKGKHYKKCYPSRMKYYESQIGG